MSNQVINTLSLVVPANANDIAPGQLEVQERRVETNEAAFEAARSFGGTGWAVFAKNPTVQRFSEGDPIGEWNSANGWIVQAEVANEDKSLHIQYFSGKWHLTTITKTDQTTYESLLVRKSLVSRDREDRMIYETCWRVSDRSGISQLVPSGYRFIGFKED